MVWLLVSTALALRPSLTREQVFADADAVVVGEVIDLSCVAEGEGFETEATLVVEASEKRTVPRELVVRLRGGRCLGVTQVVEHEARLGEDRRYALALVGSPSGWRVLGGDLGAVELRSPTAPGAPASWAEVRP